MKRMVKKIAANALKPPLLPLKLTTKLRIISQDTIAYGVWLLFSTCM